MAGAAQLEITRFLSSSNSVEPFDANIDRISINDEADILRLDNSTDHQSVYDDDVLENMIRFNNQYTSSYDV